LGILRVKDFAAAMEYYVTKLEVQNKWDWGTAPTFACVAREKGGIFLCREAQGQSGMWMSIFLEDVGALYEEYKKSGAIIRMAPTKMPWGTREMNVVDLVGHHIRMWSDATGPADEDG
jgi:predicted enzyme related to lactoylglutathione lyase